MFQTSRYQAPNKDFFWHWRYSWLLHWATIYGNTNCRIRARLLSDMSHGKHSRSTDQTDQEFIIVPMKLRLKSTVVRSCISVCSFTVNSFQNIFPLDGCDGHFRQWSKRVSFIRWEFLTFGHNNFACDFFLLNWRNETRNNLAVHIQTFQGLKLLIRVNTK